MVIAIAPVTGEEPDTRLGPELAEPGRGGDGKEPVASNL